MKEPSQRRWKILLRSAIEEGFLISAQKLSSRLITLEEDIKPAPLVPVEFHTMEPSTNCRDTPRWSINSVMKKRLHESKWWRELNSARAVSTKTRSSGSSRNRKGCVGIHPE